jgi:hypothetical protein
MCVRRLDVHEVPVCSKFGPKHAGAISLSLLLEAAFFFLIPLLKKPDQEYIPPAASTTITKHKSSPPPTSVEMSSQSTSLLGLDPKSVNAYLGKTSAMLGFDLGEAW